MKKLIPIHISLLIALAACTQTQEPLPTLLPVAQVVATETATTTATAAPTDMAPTSTFSPPLSTWTVTPFPSRTPAPPLPTATDGPSPTPVPTATNTPGPSPTPWPTWPPPPPAVTPAEPTPPPPDGPPFTDGMIAILWNPDFEEYNRVDTYQLDFAIPGKTPDEWVIQTALTGLTSRDMFPSPDGQKLALAQYQDTNGDGYVPSPRGGDAYDVFLYTIADGSLVGLTDNQFSSYPEVNWLPDSQSFTYPIHHDIWQVDIENPSQQILLTNLDNRIFGHVWSLNGEFLAFNTQGTNGPSPPELDRLYIYKASTGEVVSVFENMPITLEMRWSADNNWLAIAPGQNSGLYLINAQTFEVLEVIERGSGRIKNDWSPDGHWLLYVEDVSTIELWESSTKNSFDFIQEPYAFSQFVWAPNSSELAFTMWDEEKISLVVANRESGEMRTLYIVDSVDKSERPYGLESISEMQLLTWSPDSQWILFFAEQEEGIGLYVINREGNEAYPILETGVRSFFHYWIANLETDRTRQVVWLPDSIR